MTVPPKQSLWESWLIDTCALALPRVGWIAVKCENKSMWIYKSCLLTVLPIRVEDSVFLRMCVPLALGVRSQMTAGQISKASVLCESRINWLFQPKPGHPLLLDSLWIFHLNLSLKNKATFCASLCLLRTLPALSMRCLWFALGEHHTVSLASCSKWPTPVTHCNTTQGGRVSCQTYLSLCCPWTIHIRPQLNKGHRQSCSLPPQQH